MTTRKFIRKCQLRLRNDEQVLDLSDFHVQFEIHQATTQVPNWANITVYNISHETVALAQKEFHYVDLRVGYDEDDLGRLFFGQVRQFNFGLRENAYNTYVDLICQDGDAPYNWAVVNKRLPKGWTLQDQVDAATDALVEQGAERGYYGVLPSRGMPRGKAMYGPARDYMNSVYDNGAADWSLNNNQVEVVPFAHTKPGEALIITPQTGLIGLPQQTAEGITVKSLIDARFRYGGLIQLDNSTIQTASIPLEYSRQNTYVPSFDASGIYKIFSIDHVGDTRGNDWYSELITIPATGGNVPFRSSTFRNAQPNHGG